MAQVYGDGDPKKLQPLTVPKIVEQLERALMDIKYNQSNQSEDESAFSKTENVSVNSNDQLPRHFIGKELMLFEMVGVLNGKITELEKKVATLQTAKKVEAKKTKELPEKPIELQIIEEPINNELNLEKASINEIISNVVNSEIFVDSKI